MTELVVYLSSGKGTWNYVLKLVNEHEWDNVFVVTDEFGKKNFKSNKKVEIIVVDSSKPLVEFAKDVVGNLRGKIKGIEVAVNFVSGSGKEHMALMSALLKLGVGVRFIALEPKGISEI